MHIILKVSSDLCFKMSFTSESDLNCKILAVGGAVASATGNAIASERNPLQNPGYSVKTETLFSSVSWFELSMAVFG